MSPRVQLRDWFVFCFTFVSAVALSGCSTPWLFRGQSPDIEDLVNDDDPTTVNYVGELASAWGTDFAKVESIALMTSLEGTGSNPHPSPQRERLVAEMQSHEVRSPYNVLADPDNSLVFVRSFLRPGIQKGERFDVEVRVPPKSETTSLRGGFLLKTRMRPMEVLGNRVKTGHVTALAEGPVLVDAVFQADNDRVLEKRGRVLGGGVAMQSRPIGLIVRSDANILASSLISYAVNKRFHAIDRGVKQNVATPKNDRIIELAIPRQYKHNLARYIRVVRNLAVRERSSDRIQRRRLLEQELLEPSTSGKAALRLEAIGDEAIPSLLHGLESLDLEVRFHAAEALAYLGATEAAAVLSEVAEKEPAFRWHALTALVAMDDVEAGEALSELLHVTSVEARYGAFHAIRTRSPSDPVVQGERLGDGFQLHLISTSGEPMIHFTRTRGPEIVVFGVGQPIASDIVYIGRGLMVKGKSDRRVSVSYFTADGKEPRRRECSNRLDEVIRAITEVGGTYEDTLDFVRAAKDEDKLQLRLVVNALAKPGRKFVRDEDEIAVPEPRAASPTPELFDIHSERWRGTPESDTPKREFRDIAPKNRPPASGQSILGKLTNGFF